MKEGRLQIPLSHQLAPLQYERCCNFGIRRQKERERLPRSALQAQEELGAGMSVSSDSKDVAQPCDDEDEAYVVDLDQNHNWSGGGAFAPCLVTHGELVDMILHEVMLAEEWLVIQGGSFLREDEGFWDTRFKCCIADAVKALSATVGGQSDLKAIAGNSQILYVLGLWTMYHIVSTEASHNLNLSSLLCALSSLRSGV